MENTEKRMYEDALNTYITARGILADVAVVYERERHLARKALYDMKEAGTRKMTEEQIRSEAIVNCKDVYEEYTQAVAACDIARERLEFVKAIINNN
jgi:hypothetical protein